MIISFPYVHLEEKKQRFLSKLMSLALIAACDLQKKRIRFGPTDIQGSFG